MLAAGAEDMPEAEGPSGKMSNHPLYEDFRGEGGGGEEAKKPRTRQQPKRAL